MPLKNFSYESSIQSSIFLFSVKISTSYHSVSAMASATNDSSLETELQRIRLEERHLQKFKAEKIAEKWRQQDKYIDYLEDKLDQLKDQSKSKLDSQNQDSTRRENILIMRLASKEQEAQDMLNQIQVLCKLLY